jgi:uncharacterized membrane protein YebE (DUF533 family)
MWKKYKKQIIIDAITIAVLAIAFVAYRKKQKTQKNPATKDNGEDGAIISQLDTNAARTESDKENVRQSMRMVGG